MRVLVVDQDYTMLDTLTRALSGHFKIDVATSKGDCVDLLRGTEYELIVACERLADGSGLELLGQIAKRWPATLRVFAAERERLKLLQGRLAPFELFQTLAYPIDPRKLFATLSLADAAEKAEADTMNIQHVVLDSEGQDVSGEAGEQQQPEAPTPPAPASVRSSPAHARPSQTPARQAPAKSAPSPTRSRSETSHAGAQGQSAPRPGGAARSRARRAAPTRTPSPASRTPAGSSNQTSGPRATPGKGQANSFGSFDGAAEIAAAARASIDPLGAESTYSSSDSRTSSDAPMRQLGVVIGASVAVAAVVIWLGVKFFSGGDDSGGSAAKGINTQPHYSKEVTDLVAGIESDLKQDRFAHADSEVRRLHALAPEHPRLPFFETLLARHPGSRASAPSAAGIPGTKGKSSASAAILAATSTSSPRAPATTTIAKPPSRAASVPAATSAPAAATVAAQNATIPATPEAVARSFGSPVAPSLFGNGQRQTDPTFAGHTVEASASAAPATISTTVGSRPKAVTPVITEAQLNHQVRPEYPDSAARRGIEGYAEVAFTITEQGMVDNVTVIESSPSEIFNQAAIEAVKQWRYEPRKVNGMPTASHTQLRLEFKLDSKK